MDSVCLRIDNIHSYLIANRGAERNWPINKMLVAAQRFKKAHLCSVRCNVN